MASGHKGRGYRFRRGKKEKRARMERTYLFFEGVEGGEDRTRAERREDVKYRQGEPNKLCCRSFNSARGEHSQVPAQKQTLS